MATLENRFAIPRDRLEEARHIIIANAEFAGILTSHSNGKRTVRLEVSSGRAAFIEAPTEISSDPASASDAQSQKVANAESVCFYITPIGDEGSEVRRHADMLQRHLVEPAFQEFGIQVVRADKIEKSGLISQQIFEHIATCKYCVADLSFGNPNAFYELGVRHMTRMPTIQIIRKGDKIPFDVAQGRTIVVDLSDIYTIMERIDSARKELVEHIKNYQSSEKGKFDDNPVSIYLPQLQVRTG